MTTRRHLASGSSLLLALALLLVRPGDTAAASAECCLRGTSTAMSELRNVGQDPDEQFFMTEAAPPNLMFVLDTSGSMMHLPIAASSIAMKDRGSGCEAPAYDALLTAGAFDINGSYPPIDLGVAPEEWNGDSGFPSLFYQDKFYRYREWDEDGATAYSTAAKACEAVPTTAGYLSTVKNRRQQCITCLTTKGYYLDTRPSSSWDNSWDDESHQVFSGKFLNFYPPRFLVARTVLKDVIWDLKAVRFGLTIFNGDTGGKLISGMNPPCDKALDPEDSSWTSNRKSRINELNSSSKVSFSSWTPLAETLLNVGQYFSSDDTVYQSWFGKGWTTNSFANGSLNSQTRSICWGCQVSGVVIVTDGAPANDNCVPSQVRGQNVTCTGCDQRDGNCGGSCYGTCTDSTPNQLDDVAKWLADHDLQTKNPSNGSFSMDGKQRLIAYTVGFGLDHPLLKHTAEVTGGIYYTAKDKESLKSSLLAAIADINRRATAFGSSSISTLQSASTESTATVPRFIPDQPGTLWKGMLYRFRLGYELLNGCEKTEPEETPHPMDVDGDHACASLYYIDRDGDIVEEDPTTGAFLKKSTSNPAKPIWEAGRELTYVNPTYAENETAARRDPDDRSLWTVVDSNADGKLDSADQVIEFSAANAATLMPYLQIGADVRSDSVCTGFANLLGVDSSDATRSTWGESCAKAVIEYYRGRRSLDVDPANRSKPRNWLLGDIFHSSVAVVEPAASVDTCPNYEQTCLPALHTPVSGNHGEAREAYEAYVTDDDGPCGGVACEKRRKVMLVGANDGFLHAFDYGAVKQPLKRALYTNAWEYDEGTGEELWGFMPPDLLGKLKHNIDKHAYFVDGSAMVRDIWVDADSLSQGDGKRDKSEFHTVAVIGERNGGQHFFALDVTRDAKRDDPPRPRFLWMWPQPCSERVGEVGESWSNFVPYPPPFGPVLLDADTTGYPAGFDFEYRAFSKTADGWVDKKASAQERWVVMLNGGYDRSYLRGRGVATVDAWTGKTLWEAFFDPSATDLRSKLEYPIPAGVAMVDIGSGEPGRNANGLDADYAFDTANFGDMGGNLWTVRFFEPGKLDSTTGLVTNWPIARAFQTERDDGTSMLDRRAINYIAENTMEAGYGNLRTFFGTGDRSAVLDSGGDTCSVDNLGPCIHMGCEVTSEYLLKNDDKGGKRIKMKWKAGKITERILESRDCSDSSCVASCESTCRSNCTATACVSASNSSANLETCLDACDDSCPSSCVTSCQRTELKQRVEIKGCPSGTTEGADTLKREAQFVCDMVSGQLNCKLTKLADSNSLSDFRKYKSTALASLPKHRFFGVHSFGGLTPFGFDDAAAAADFDAARRTETDLFDLGTLSSTPTQGAREGEKGWYVTYDAVDQRTASPAASVEGGANNDRTCISWNTLTPPSGSGGVCATTGSQMANLVQADAVTGLPDCMIGFRGERALQRSVITPPARPAEAVFIANGRIYKGLISADPGSPPVSTLSSVETDLAQSIYTLELTPQEHQCRHVEGKGEMCGH